MEYYKATQKEVLVNREILNDVQTAGSATVCSMENNAEGMKRCGVWQRLSAPFTARTISLSKRNMKS